jgi:FkbM family methyltransferase
MSATLRRQEAIISNLNLLHTRLGFDLLVDPGDYLSVLLTRDGVFEAPETDLVTRILRPGDICIDAGCHVGYYSCLFAKLVGEKGRVYSFDANPQACNSTRRNLGLNGLYFAEVIQTALADIEGMTSFHISTDDQTGLSSLGPIPICKETISVLCLRLEAFLDERRVDSVRLLKLDVEGAEEIVLRGLGRFLAAHVIDYILVECFDERLQLLETSAEKVAGILKSAGYTPWEYGIENPAGWSQATEVRSRGDCNYLFLSPAITEKVPSVSLAAALGWTQGERGRLCSERNDLQYQRDQLLSENTSLKQNVEKLQNDTDWLLDSIKVHEEQAAEKRRLEALWEGVENSASWRLLNKWRKVRNLLAPENSWHRRLYDSLLRSVSGKS